MSINDIIIDQKFRDMIPPLSDEEFSDLRRLIAKDGCRDPLTVWRGMRILLDGHHRYKLCGELGKTFQVVELEFDDRESAADWIDANQLGRRNLSADQQSLIRGRRYNRAKKQGARTDLTSGQNVQKSTTAANLAKQHGVDEKTIRRDGEFAKAVEKVKAVDPDIENKVTRGKSPPKAAVVTAARMMESQPEKALAVLMGEKTLTDVKREQKESARETRREENRRKIESFQAADSPAPPDAKFATIVIDPPWDWGDEGDQDQLGRSRPTYQTMTFEQLLSFQMQGRDFADFADQDCHIYLWITNRSLPKGFALLDAWGFRYVTCLTWCKPSIGMGNYFRGSTEQVLFGVKGSQPLKRKDVGTWFQAARGRGGHSSKPIEFYDLVESCSPGPFLEVFARSNRPGWVSLGAEA